METSITRDEFLRLLPAAVGPFHLEGDTATHADGGRAWTIRLVPLPACRLGSLSVPRLRVEIALEGYAEAEAAEFMARFRRGFLRGGG